MHLSADDAALFYKLMFALQFDVSQQLALTPTVTSQAAYRDLDQQAKLVVRDALYEPFKGQIIYDGLLSTYKIFFGTGVKSSLREEYRVAKQNGRIIESLERRMAHR